MRRESAAIRAAARLLRWHAAKIVGSQRITSDLRRRLPSSPAKPDGPPAGHL